MSNKPSIYKTKVSLQLDNEVIVALDRKAADDGTSRNSVANYLISHELQRIINGFSRDDRQKLAEMEEKNRRTRNEK